ncbi:MAG: HEAT repeat domain-containing protein [Proteobacteria bacterium]|nr:HEAT repeat domain-containing protein [Pseudomonadota bacterium]
MSQSPNSVSDHDLKLVIADFLDQGHVDNIIAMFLREPKYYAWTGDILRDERFSVRLGISVLFEELLQIQPEKLELAIPSLAELLTAGEPLLRGEAISLLGIIGSESALCLVRNRHDDPDLRVREMVRLVLGEPA